LDVIGERFNPNIREYIIFDLMRSIEDTYIITKIKIELANHMVDKYHEDNNFDFKSDREYRKMVRLLEDDLEKKLNKAISDKNSCRFATDL
jgi:hypothetical protein